MWMNESARVHELEIRLRPGASQCAIHVPDDGPVEIRLTARPIDGEANHQLIKILAKTLRIPQGSLHISSGEKSRNKRIVCESISGEKLRVLLKDAKIKF